MHPVSKRELQQALGWSVAIMLATCLPYLVVWWYTPLQAVFPWTLFNSDDHGVYFAWMRQAADGHLLFRNLFTAEPQRGIYLQTYFLILGQLARLPGIDVPLAYQIGRFVFGVTTLLLVYRLAAFFAPDRFTRGCIFWTTALSAGVGWLFWHDYMIQRGPVDVWQPEAITFASLYTNGLFAVALTLMLGVVVCLLMAEERGPRWAVGAGLCGLLLGNIHSYDVIHLTAVWCAYLLAKWVVGRRFPAREVGHGLIAGLVAVPSVAYMAWLYATEPVFKARADTATLSPELPGYLLGYGLLLPLAALGAWRLWQGAQKEKETGSPSLRWLLPIVWALIGLPLAYLPFAFQRKLIMGYHLPLALLAGFALAWLARKVSTRDSSRRAAMVVAALGVGVLSISNVRYLVRDIRLARMENITSTGAHHAYWPEGDLRAFEWLRDHTAPDATLLTWPMNGVFAPAYSGRKVYAGHWGETPRYEERLKEVFAFYWGLWSSDERLQFLRRFGITHVVESPIEREWLDIWGRKAPVPRRPLSAEPYLQPVFAVGDTTVYEVRSP